MVEPGSGKGGGAWEGGLAALHRFARQAPRREETRCELCAAPMPAEHRHLLLLPERRVECACRACALLFDREAASLGKYRLIPERRLRLTAFQVADGGWQELGIPVGLAFLGIRSPAGTVTASYPGPAGAVEAEVEPAGWEALAARIPVLTELEPDVEALLVDRSRQAPAGGRYFVVPIDDCYRLVGVIRSHWRGLTGGTAVWEQVQSFFENLEGRSRPV